MGSKNRGDIYRCGATVLFFSDSGAFVFSSLRMKTPHHWQGGYLVGSSDGHVHQIDALADLRIIQPTSKRRLSPASSCSALPPIICRLLQQPYPKASAGYTLSLGLGKLSGLVVWLCSTAATTLTYFLQRLRSTSNAFRRIHVSLPGSGPPHSYGLQWLLPGLCHLQNTWYASVGWHPSTAVVLLLAV